MSETSSGPQFTVHRIRRGYNIAEVDAFLDSVGAALRHGGAVPDIRNAVFSSAYGGYDEAEVDAFLDDLNAQLGQQ